MLNDAERGKRQDKRDSLFLSANVCVGGQDIFVTRVRNLSPGGMMIDAVIELVVGAVVVAELRGIGKIAGRIAWAAANRAGVAFDAEIDPKLARAPGGTKVELPAYLQPVAERRPGLAVR